ncbi:MAG: hypothetical protein EP330_01875 [Deltaproteobacteria bacterium]|nr:MAG: hypothetical protein EP330_01875 [Deltaproteobacteria bacterium]
MARHIILATLLLTACAGEEETPLTEQPTSRVDFEGMFPPAGVDLTDHTTDGGVWEQASFSAFGEGETCAHLTESDPDSFSEAGLAALGLQPIDLEAPAVFSVDVAYATRPFNAMQRMEIRLVGELADQTVHVDLDGASGVFVDGGTDPYEPADDEWFTLTASLDPEELGDSVQISLVILEDFAGLRPSVYFDNLIVAAE